MAGNSTTNLKGAISEQQLFFSYLANLRLKRLGESTGQGSRKDFVTKISRQNHFIRPSAVKFLKNSISWIQVDQVEKIRLNQALFFR